MTDIIRCYECKHFKPIGKNEINGWCQNPVFPKKERVAAIDFCDNAERKEGGE